MFKNQFIVRKSFMIFMGYFLLGGLFAGYGVDKYYFKGPKYQDPRTTEAVDYFKQKCIKFNIKDICNQRFQNLVKIEVVDKIWFRTSFNPDVSTIGLTEFSVFSPLTKISIDKKILVDSFLFDSTVVHELGHAILNLKHDDSKLAIMNTQIFSANTLETNYDALVDEMFKDYIEATK